VAVITNSVPVTGTVLPFVSYGGSALVTGLSSVGILLNISRADHHRRLERGP
jgi:cell division protein FtsW